MANSCCWRLLQQPAMPRALAVCLAISCLPCYSSQKPHKGTLYSLTGLQPTFKKPLAGSCTCRPTAGHPNVGRRPVRTCTDRPRQAYIRRTELHFKPQSSTPRIAIHRFRRRTASARASRPLQDKASEFTQCSQDACYHRSRWFPAAGMCRPACHRYVLAPTLACLPSAV